MKFPKDIEKHLSRWTINESFLKIYLKFFFYSLFIFFEIMLRSVFIIFIRIFFVLPVFLGFLLFKITFFWPLYTILRVFVNFIKFLFLKVMANTLKIVSMIVVFLYLKKKNIKNLDLNWPSDFWFNNSPKTENIEIDFLQYNRSLSKLLFRKNFKPLRILVSEKGITEYLNEFKLKIFNNIPHFRYSSKETFKEFKNKSPYPILYRLNIDYSDFEFLSKYSVTEIDHSNLLLLKQHRNNFLLFNTLFNFFKNKLTYNILNYSSPFYRFVNTDIIKKFYNENNFLKDYHDNYHIIRRKFNNNNFKFLFTNVLNIKNKTKSKNYDYFYSSNSVFQHFLVDSPYFKFTGVKSNIARYRNYNQNYFTIYKSSIYKHVFKNTLFSYLFQTDNLYYKRSTKNFKILKRNSKPSMEYDFGLRSLFWNLIVPPVKFFKKSSVNNLNYLIERPLLLNQWNLFYPKNFQRVYYNLNSQHFKNKKNRFYKILFMNEINNSQSLDYYNNYFDSILRNFSKKIVKNLNIYNKKLSLDLLPPLIKIPHGADYTKGLWIFEKQFLNPKTLSLNKFLINIPKYPFYNLRKQQAKAQRVSLPLWELNLGKYNHELLWSSRVLSPFSIAPTKKRMTSADFWILKRSFLKGHYNVKEIYYYLKNDKIIKFLRLLETKVLFLIFNYLPTDIILVELKYFFLNYLLELVFFDQILINLSKSLNLDLLDIKWFLIRFLIIISDIYLWFIWAYIKITLSVLVNIVFDDFCGLYLYYMKTFKIYYLDSFLPIQSRVPSPRNLLFNEFSFLNPDFSFFDGGNLDLNKKYIIRKKKILVSNWFRPSERNRKSMFGLYNKSSLRFFYYELANKPKLRKKTSFTWIRGNTILFNYGGKYILSHYYSRKNLRIRRLMRYNTHSSNLKSMHHVRKMPFPNYWPNYNFLFFNNYYGLRNQNFILNKNNFFLFENKTYLGMHSDDVFLNNEFFFFNSLFNNSLRPKNLMSKFKHFYFFNNIRGFRSFRISRDHYKYSFHFIDYSGLKKSNSKHFELPVFDFLSMPGYLSEKTHERFYFTLPYRFSQNRYQDIFYFAKKIVKFIDIFLNLHLFFSPLNYNYESFKNNNLVGFKNDTFLMDNPGKIFLNQLFFDMIFFSSPNKKNFKLLKKESDMSLISEYYSLFWVFLSQFFDNASYGNYIKFWTYTSPFMERNFISANYISVSSTYCPKFLDDNSRLENTINTLSYNSLFNHIVLGSEPEDEAIFNTKSTSIFVPGWGVEVFKDFFWFLNHHNDEFYYLYNYTSEWPSSDLSTLYEKNRNTLNFQHYSLFRKRRKLLKFYNQNFNEIESGIGFDNTIFDQTDTYFIWKHHKKLNREFVNSNFRNKRQPFFTYPRKLRMHYKIVSTRKITLFLILVWYNFIFLLLKFLFFIFLNYKIKIIFFYLIFLLLIIFLNSFKISLFSFKKQQRDLLLWYSERMLLFKYKKFIPTYKKYNLSNFETIQIFGQDQNEINERFKWINYYLPETFKFLGISNDYKNLRNFLILNYFYNFFKIIKKLIIIQLYQLLYFFKDIIFRNLNKFYYLESYKILNKLYLIKNIIFYFNFIRYNLFKILYDFLFLLIFNKKLYKFVFSLNFFMYFFKIFLLYFKKFFHLFFWFINFFLFSLILKNYLNFKNNLFLTHFNSLLLMFFFIIFLIWFFSIVSSKFRESFLNSKYPIDQFLQDYNVDFAGEAFVYEDSMYFYLQPFQEDEMFDSDSFPFYYAWFTKFIGTNFVQLLFMITGANENFKQQKEENWINGYGFSADNDIKIYGTPAYIKEGIKNFFFHVWSNFIRQKDMYRFNNDVSLFYEYEESLRTVTNLVINVNYLNSKNYKKFDLPWEVADSFIYNQYLANSFWYYHSELFYDPDKVSYFDNAETSTDYTQYLYLENVGDTPNLPVTGYDLFEGDDSLELIELNTEDFEVDDVPIELLDFSEEANLSKIFNKYESFFDYNNSLIISNPYNFYSFFNDNDISEKPIIFHNGWLNEVVMDRFLLNIVNKDFFFPSDNEILSFINIYSNNSNFRNNLESTLLQTTSDEFRNFLSIFMFNLMPSNKFRHNLYSAQTLLHLSRRLNYKKLPFKKLYIDYLKRFPKNRFVSSNLEQTVSLRWDRGFDIALSLYHPHDVLFRLTKKIGIFVFSPYNQKSILENFLKIEIVPIIGYEIFNNKYKRLFFSNVSYFVKKLNLVNYPDLSYQEAERLWSFLGCTKKEWSYIENKYVPLIFPYDDWDFPFILISFLFAIHYHRSNRMRGSKNTRRGSPLALIVFTRSQISKRTTKRNRRKRKKLLKPFEKSPTYIAIDFFDMFCSFFESFILNRNNYNVFTFFLRYDFCKTLYIILSDLFIIYFSYFYYIFPKFNFYFLKYFFLEKIAYLSYFLLFNFNFLFWVFLFIFFKFILIIFIKFSISKIFVWLKVSFFFSYTLFIIFLLFILNNSIFLLTLFYFLNYIYICILMFLKFIFLFI